MYSTAAAMMSWSLSVENVAALTGAHPCKHPRQGCIQPRTQRLRESKRVGGRVRHEPK
jgi:hypothetical protein